MKILYAICAILGLIAVFFTDSLFAEGRFFKTIAIAVIALVIFVANFIIMRNPDCRRHSGLTEDDLTVAQYKTELAEKKRKREQAKEEPTRDTESK